MKIIICSMFCFVIGCSTAVSSTMLQFHTQPFPEYLAEALDKFEQVGDLYLFRPKIADQQAILVERIILPSDNPMMEYPMYENRFYVLPDEMSSKLNFGSNVAIIRVDLPRRERITAILSSGDISSYVKSALPKLHEVAKLTGTDVNEWAFFLVVEAVRVDCYLSFFCINDTTPDFVCDGINLSWVYSSSSEPFKVFQVMSKVVWISSLNWQETDPKLEIGNSVTPAFLSKKLKMKNLHGK